jgi:hypothetical protein
MTRHANQSHLEIMGLTKASVIDLDAAAKGATALTLRFANGEAMAQPAGRRADDCEDDRRARSAGGGPGLAGGDWGDGGGLNEDQHLRCGKAATTPSCRSNSVDSILSRWWQASIRLATFLEYLGIAVDYDARVGLAQSLQRPAEAIDLALQYGQFIAMI